MSSLEKRTLEAWERYCELNAKLEEQRLLESSQFPATPTPTEPLVETFVDHGWRFDQLQGEQ